MTLHTLRGETAAKTPFDLSKSVRFLERFAPTAGEQWLERRAFAKAFRVRGRTVAVTIDATDDPSALTYAVHAKQPIDDALRDAAIDHARFVLGLDDDVARFYAIAENDADFAPIRSRHHGLHHPKFASAFEIAAWAVLTQRTTIQRARAIKRAITSRFGDAIDIDGRSLATFPDAESIADLPRQALRDIVPDPRRADAIAAIARALADRGERFLREAPFDDAEAWLRALPRIGEWSSAFILFRGLGRMPRLAIKGGPIADAARAAYGGDLSDDAVVAIAERYGEWCGYWALYLRAS
jgi:3-methyladenine DNA glycosylase/8-oxoguanine DNA glycosylase